MSAKPRHLREREDRALRAMPLAVTVIESGSKSRRTKPASAKMNLITALTFQK